VLYFDVFGISPNSTFSSEVTITYNITMGFQDELRTRNFSIYGQWWVE
jgi:hypothetical protein